MQSMQEKVCIVTGAASGVGLATSRSLLSAGAFVLGVDIAEAPASLASLANFKFHQCNLTELSAPADVVKACHDAFGPRIDALLNVAGIMDAFSSVDTLRDSEWDRVIAVNLTAPVKLMREVVPVMQRQTQGSIVNVASKAAMSGAVAGVAYTASKHGLVGATKNVAWRYKDDKIRCNAVCPGAVDDTNIAASMDRETFDMASYTIAQPIITAHGNDNHVKSEQIASLLTFLASDASAGMSGSIIPIDGAWCTI